MKVLFGLFICIQLGALVSGCDVIDTWEGRSFLIDPKFHWTNKTVPYIIDKSIVKEKKNIVKAFKTISSKTCLKFKVRKDEENFLNFTSDPKSCYASIGMKGGEQKVHLRKDCVKEPSLLHLIVHSLGFYHEHNRPDRDRFIKIHFDNVDGKAFFDNDFRNSTMDTINYIYDYNSIMHMGAYFRAKNAKKPTVTSKYIDAPAPKKTPEKLSATDVKKIRRMYKCNK